MKKIIVGSLIIFILWISYFYTKTYNGIDISHHNNVCWKCIAEDPYIKFCYIKATEGETIKDYKCSNNIRNATKLNLNIGLYHYFRTNVSPINQFNNFKSIYNKFNTNLIPMIDIEDHGNDFSNIDLVNKQLLELIKLYYNEYETYPIVYLGSLNAFRTFTVIYKCKIWIRTLNYSNYIPNCFIKQIAVDTVGCNYVDLNYCSNINKIKLK